VPKCKEGAEDGVLSIAGVAFAISCFPFGQRCGALSMLSLVVQIITGVLYESHASEISIVNKQSR